VPKIVEFRSEPLPKTNLGKILRRQLREAPAATGAASTVGTPAS
jgi:long-chain acyl-CoA synthetase